MNEKISPKVMPLLVICAVLGTIALAEYSIMFIMEYAPDLDVLSASLIDSFLLILIMSPIIYLLVYRPLDHQLHEVRNREEILQGLALTDELTGLYNRRGFLSYAAQLIKLSNRARRGLVLIFMDVDNMKEINDKFSHEEGDEVLKCTANVLRDNFRGSDVVSRIGGDEFVILAVEASVHSMDLLRKRLRDRLRTAKCCESLKRPISVSVGIVYYDPEKPCPIEELLHKADVMMYNEKKSNHR